jgi:hypothetical protein
MPFHKEALVTRILLNPAQVFTPLQRQLLNLLYLLKTKER